MLWNVFLHHGPLPRSNGLCIDVHVRYVRIAHHLTTLVNGVDDCHVGLGVAWKLLETFILPGLRLVVHLHIKMTGRAGHTHTHFLLLRCHSGSLTIHGVHICTVHD